MISLKYRNLIILLGIYCININAESENSNNNDGVILFDTEGFKGSNTIIKPGNYLLSTLQKIKSIRIPNGYEIKLSDIDDYDNENAKVISYPSIDDLNKNIETNNTKTVTISKADNNTTPVTHVDVGQSINNKNIYNLDNIDTSQYKYLYVLKVDLNSEDGIARHDEYNSNTSKYFGRKIKTMRELTDKEKEQVTEITIDYSPDFQGLPDLTKYKNLKNIKILFNVFHGKNEAFIKQEYNKIINYINKIHPLTEIEIQGNIPSYYTVQDNKFFGFNLTTFPSLHDNIQEIHLINCSKLSSIDFNKYKKLKKVYMYGNTFEFVSTEQWKKMIEQIYTLALNTTKQESYKVALFITKTRNITIQALLTHIQLPRTFTGEIPKISDPYRSQIQYLSALGATSVAQDAFKYSQSLREVYLPNVEEVKSNAFYHCFNIEKVSLDKCEILQEGAFKTNAKLKSMHLPLVKKIEKLALAYTRSNTLKIGDLNNIEFKNSNEAGVYLPFCEELGEGALRGDSTDQVQFVNINLPVCKTIQKEALRHLKVLKEVNIPEVEVIGQSAFEDCGELTKVGDIKSISGNNEIFLPNVTEIANYAFKNGDKEQIKNIKGENNTIEAIILPKCKSIGMEAFMRWRTLIKLSIPKCVSIGKLSFYDAYKLQKIEATSLETIEDKVFLYASSEIKSFKTINGKEEVDNYLELPNVKTIKSQAFGGNNDHNIGTKVVKLPECFEMADNAFQGSRISVLEAPKLNNTAKVLSLTGSNIIYNASLLK